MWPVRHAHGVRARSHPGNLDRLVAHATGDLLGGQDADRRPVGHRADVLHRERRGHHRRLPDIFHGEPLGLLGIGVVQGVDVVLHGHHRQLFCGGPELVHVPLDHHGVVTGVEPAHRKIKIRVRCQRDELIAFPGVHPRHRILQLRIVRFPLVR